MAANVEKPSPEMSGLLAANSGFALVEAAFSPVSLLVKPAMLWFAAVISVSALAAAAGVTIAGDLPLMAAVGEPPVAAETVSPVATPSIPEPTPSIKKTGALPVVLRGQPLAMGRRS